MQLNTFKSELPFNHKLLRFAWGVCWLVLFLPSPRLLHPWRRFLLRIFGSRVGHGVKIYNTAKVYYPPHLQLGDYAIIGPHVDIYCVAPIVIADNSMVSQYCYLCSAGHDYHQPHLPLMASPISIGSRSWICAKAFVGPGVSIGSDVVVAACAVVVKDICGNQIVGGNPARTIKVRNNA